MNPMILLAGSIGPLVIGALTRDADSAMPGWILFVLAVATWVAQRESEDKP